jgi:hypothetical protein
MSSFFLLMCSRSQNVTDCCLDKQQLNLRILIDARMVYWLTYSLRETTCSSNFYASIYTLPPHINIRSITWCDSRDNNAYTTTGTSKSEPSWSTGGRNNRSSTPISGLDGGTVWRMVRWTCSKKYLDGIGHAQRTVRWTIRRTVRQTCPTVHTLCLELRPDLCPELCAANQTCWILSDATMDPTPDTTPDIHD